MKNIITLLFVLCTVVACDYEEINTNAYGVSDSELGPLKYGARFMGMQQLVTPIGSPSLTTGPGNDLQNTDLISSGNYIGYFGNNNNWGFNIESNWNFADNRMKYAYENFYSKMFLPWNEIYSIAKDIDSPSDQAVLAMANIVKNVAWLRATDVFGPISYTVAGGGSIAPKFDKQDVVYKSIMVDLAKSVEVLKDIPFNVMSKYDLIYNGKVNNWVKLANSLMLRMAVRVHFTDEALAREYIAKALNPGNGGVIETPGDEAKIQSSDKMPLLNSMLASIDEYGETRMGTTIWSYLDGYKDPRMQIYFNEGVYGEGTYSEKKGYFAVAPTNKVPKKTDVYSAFYASKPKVSSNSPLYWYRASETYFLKAEAALFGLLEGSAENFYKEGVQMSFKENGAGDATAYLEGTTKPTKLGGGKYLYDDWYSADLSIGNTSVKWSHNLGTSAIKEEQLQKIITQKYLALYPNAVEAWTEYRRTGYPYLMKPMDTAAPGRIGAEADCRAPERFRFAPSAYNSNPNMTEISSLLGGADIGATKLWWVRADRPKQPNQ